MIGIDIHGYRIAGDHVNVTLSRLDVAKSGKLQGQTVEKDARYYPDLESACAALAKSVAIGGNGEVVASLEDYVRRLNAARDEILDAVRGQS